MSEVQRFHITENAASGIGLCVLLGLVALAVSIFLWTSAEAKEYRFLEEEPFETEYGVEGMVRQRQREYKDTHTRLVTVGVVLCVLAAVPLFAAMCINDGSDLLYIAAVCALLVLVAIGCLALVTAGVYQGAMEPAAGGGRLHPPPEKAPQADGHRHHDLLAHRHGGVPAVHLRSPRQRPTPVQLDHLGGGGRAVCRRYGHRSHHQPQPRLMMPHNRSLGEK